jgi:S-formylglutathione hydrolase FrmB
MRKIITIPFILAAFFCGAQTSIIKESLKIKSVILGKEVEYSIYLPADYDTRKFPVLYLLHGFGDDETGWTQFGEVKHIADKQTEKGEMTPMIIAMPDGGVSWYVNSADGKGKYEDFFINEFIPFIDSNYKTRIEKRYRAISGLSMGGFGTCIMAMKHPDLFSSAAPLSAGIFTTEEIIGMPDQDWAGALAIPYGNELKGKDRISAHYKNNSILDIIAKNSTDELKKVRFYIDCGDKDFLIKGNMALHAALIDKKVPHEFRVRNGIHNWPYWRTALPEVFSFVSESFHQN